MTPRRIQRRRTKGWRMPEGAVYVGRGSRWGNPYAVVKEGPYWGVRPPGYAFIEPATYAPTRHDAADHALGYYHIHIGCDHDAIRAELAGKDLACWCPLDQPCHADVLLEIANGGTS